MATEIIAKPDIDYDDLEQQDLLTGEQVLTQDDIRNCWIAAGLTGLAGLLCLVAMILTWVLYYRERTRTFLWHGIWLIFAMLFAFACAGWAAMSAGAMSKRQAPNPTLTLIIFVGAMIFAVYCLAEGFWWVYYRHSHFSYIVGLKTDNDLWDNRMKSGSSFEDGWKSSRRMMWWTCFFTFISGFAFAFCAYAARNAVWNKYQLSRIGLFIAALGMVLSGFLMIYWAEECFEYQNLTAWSYGGKLISFIKVLGIIGVILGVVVAVVNLIRNKLGYFVLGLLLLVFMFLCVCADGSLWRDIGDVQKGRLNANCSDVLGPIHENSLSGTCINGGKYLNPGQTCSKQYLVNRWEGGNSIEMRSLNPACCQLGKAWFNYPFMLLAFWTLIMLLSALVAAGLCLYLSDTSEYLSNAHRTSSGLDYLLFALPILLAIAFVLYFIFRPKNTLEFQGKSYIRSYIDGDKAAVDGFPIVPKSIISGAVPPANTDGCFNYETANFVNPVFSATDSTCTSNCIERVALSSETATFEVPSDLQGASQGSSSGKAYFFPNCNSNDESFKLFYGTNDQLKNLLNKVKVCPKYVGAVPVIRFRHDQITANSIDGEGLRSGESTFNAPVGVCADGFTSADASTTCTGNCAVVFTRKGSFVSKTLKGAFTFIKNGASSTDVHPDVKFEASSNGRKIGSGATLLSGGIFMIGNIPVYTDSSYILQLAVTDPKNVFLPKTVDVFIDRNYGSQDEISAGKIRLLTADGKFCEPTDTTCIANRQTLQGSIPLKVQNGTNPAAPQDPLKGATVTINQHHSVKQDVVDTFVTDENGNGKSKALNFGAYTATVSRIGFNPATHRVDLQEEGRAPLSTILTPSDDEYAMKVVADMNEPNADFDLLLSMKNAKGTECTVSPYNKYCPYAAHLSDVESGVGQEVVGVRNLALANYASMIAPSPAYDTTCNAATVSEEAIGHYASWNWESFKSSKGLQDIIFTVRNFIGFGQTQVDGSGSVKVPLTREYPVETSDQAEKSKTVLAVDGVVVPVNERTSINTIVTGGRQLITAEPIVVVASNKTTNATTADGNVTTNIVVFNTSLPNKQINFSNETNTTVFNNGSKKVELLSNFNGSVNSTTSTGDLLAEQQTGFKYNAIQNFKNGSTENFIKNYTQSVNNLNVTSYLLQNYILLKGGVSADPVISTYENRSFFNANTKVNKSFSTSSFNEFFPSTGISKLLVEMRNFSNESNAEETGIYQNLSSIKGADSNTSSHAIQTVKYSNATTLVSKIVKTSSQNQDSDETHTYVSNRSWTSTNTSVLNNLTIVSKSVTLFTNKTTLFARNSTEQATNQTDSSTTGVSSINSTFNYPDNYTNVTYFESFTGIGKPTNESYTATIVLDYKNGKKTTFLKNQTLNETVPVSSGRRLLTQKDESVLLFSHLASGPDYILVSCFTGFGEASLVQLNQFTSSKPTADQCAEKVQELRSNFTLDKLRDAMKNAGVSV